MTNFKAIMNIIKSILILWVIIFFIDSTHATERALIIPEDSLVVVTSKTLQGIQAGNGFVIGDGTLVVTAYHSIFEGSESGQHEMAGLVRLFSPYLGEGSDAEIVAFDRQLDLAILKVAWGGHRALKLADDKCITSAEYMEIAGMPDTILGMGSEDLPECSQIFDVQHEKLKTGFVAIKQKVPPVISLTGTGILKRGWSGSPMLIPETSEVCGCFVRLSYSNAGEATSQGPAVNQVKKLLDKTDQLQSLKTAKTIIPRGRDAKKSSFLFLRGCRYFARDKYVLALEDIQSLIDMHIDSAFLYTLLGSIAEKQNKHEQAEQYYQKALKLNPDGTSLKILYAQYLSPREPEKAINILTDLWKYERMRPAAALLMFKILFERGEFQRCYELLSEALKVNPNNAYLHMTIGSCQYSLGKKNDAIDSVTKAVNLFPEAGAFRAPLAQVLEDMGNFDEAEKHFRKLLIIEPNNPVAHVLLAQFLSNHRPSANEEALKEAQIALELPAKSGLSKQQIEQLINDLRSRHEKKAMN